MLEQLVKDYLIKTAEVDPAKFDQPDLKVADLGLDSLGLVEMLFEIEDRYGFQMPDAMTLQSMSFADMIQAIEKAVREHYNGEIPDLTTIEAAHKQA